MSQEEQEEQEEPHQNYSDQKTFFRPKFVLTQMNFYELLNLRLSKLLSAKVLFKLEFDTKDQVL